MPIYVLCPDENKPSGGAKKLYRHVDVLNLNGWSATIVHRTPGFRCTWFDNATHVAYASDVKPTRSDYLVIPEVYGPAIPDIQPGVRRVIFNQGCYLTFHGYSLDKKQGAAAYLHPDVDAALVVSEDSRKYLRYVFPELEIFRLRYGIDPSMFRYQPSKKRQMAFMPRRGREDARQVINALNYRGALKTFELAPIEVMSEREAASVLQDSLLFLSFSRSEGFGLPPAEAMACGCIVVGFHGMGGREYFKPEHCYPVAQGDIAAFVREVERVVDLAERDPELLAERGRRAAGFIKEHYSLTVEESDIVQFWSGRVERG